MVKLELDGIDADSLIEMLRASFTLENWEGMILIADRLYDEISTIYHNHQHEITSGVKAASFQLRRSMVYYFGYSLCLKGIALQKQGMYHEARACIDQYAQLDRLTDSDAKSAQEVEYYRQIAAANRYVVELSEGNTFVLPDYLQYLRSNEEELLPGLITILESAIAHTYQVDDVLSEFQESISTMNEYYRTQRNIRYYSDFRYLIAKYYYINGKLCDSTNATLLSLASSVTLKDDIGFRKSAALFETLREQATPVQLNEYKRIMLQILD